MPYVLVTFSKQLTLKLHPYAVRLWLQDTVILIEQLDDRHWSIRIINQEWWKRTPDLRVIAARHCDYLKRKTAQYSLAESQVQHSRTRGSRSDGYLHFSPAVWYEEEVMTKGTESEC